MLTSAVIILVIEAIGTLLRELFSNSGYLFEFESNTADSARILGSFDINGCAAAVIRLPRTNKATARAVRRLSFSEEYTSRVLPIARRSRQCVRHPSIPTEKQPTEDYKAPHAIRNCVRQDSWLSVDREVAFLVIFGGLLLVAGGVLWMSTAATYSDASARAKTCTEINLPSGDAPYDGGLYPSCEQVRTYLSALVGLRTTASASVASGIVTTALAFAVPRPRFP